MLAARAEYHPPDSSALDGIALLSCTCITYDDSSTERCIYCRLIKQFFTVPYIPYRASYKDYMAKTKQLYKKYACITHVTKHFELGKGWFGWCEFHGRIHLLASNGKPFKANDKVFSRDPKTVLKAVNYHKALKLESEAIPR